jgi:hypothetical protein
VPAANVVIQEDQAGEVSWAARSADDRVAYTEQPESYQAEPAHALAVWGVTGSIRYFGRGLGQTEKKRRLIAKGTAHDINRSLADSCTHVFLLSFNTGGLNLGVSIFCLE